MCSSLPVWYFASLPGELSAIWSQQAAWFFCKEVAALKRSVSWVLQLSSLLSFLCFLFHHVFYFHISSWCSISHSTIQSIHFNIAYGATSVYWRHYFPSRGSFNFFFWLGWSSGQNWIKWDTWLTGDSADGPEWLWSVMIVLLMISGWKIPASLFDGFFCNQGLLRNRCICLYFLLLGSFLPFVICFAKYRLFFLLPAVVYYVVWRKMFFFFLSFLFVGKHVGWQYGGLRDSRPSFLLMFLC